MEATMSTKSVIESTILNLSNPGESEPEKSNAVNFEVCYPKDYKGTRYWADGTIIEISIESAALFEKRGLGKLVAAKGDKPDDDEPDAESKPKRGRKKSIDAD